jgi:hypothetical protein
MLPAIDPDDCAIPKMLLRFVQFAISIDVYPQTAFLVESIMVLLLVSNSGVLLRQDSDANVLG